MTKFTIIVGTIEFFPTYALIHSINEVYKASSWEELEALEQTFEDEGLDYMTIETYIGNIEVTNETLKALIWG
jgi:uncharacterized membrane protein (GlpM family)